MTKYLLTYHGVMEPMSDDPADVEAAMQEWGAWFGSMGEALVDGGNPVIRAASIAPDGAETENPTSLSGYSIISADDLAGATAIAKGCPVLKNGHTVQISETIEI